MSNKINAAEFSLSKFFIECELFNNISLVGDNRWKFAFYVGDRSEATDGGFFMIFVFGFGAFDEWGGIEASLVVPFINFGC